MTVQKRGPHGIAISCFVGWHLDSLKLLAAAQFGAISDKYDSVSTIMRRSSFKR